MKLRNNSGDIQSDPDKMTSEGAPITKQDVIDGRVYPNRLVYMKYLMQCESEENPKTLGVQSLHGDGKTAEKRLCLKTPFFYLLRVLRRFATRRVRFNLRERTPPKRNENLDEGGYHL